MIVLDGSALFAILKGEDDSERCRRALADADGLLVSAGSLTEMLIVAARRGFLERLELMLRGLAPTIVPLTEARARAALDAYRRWGESFSVAKLNLGDSFAYALAKEQDCALLYVGDDFAKTDIVSGLA